MKMLNERGVISEELLSIIKNSNDLLFVKNRDLVYIASSENYATDCVHVSGSEDVIGKTDFELFADNSIALKNRENDELLFASGKSMTEFKEEYIDSDGKKHICLTSKYLLHDKSGNPVAIFGQYHDIGTQIEEIARDRDINNNVIGALGKSFFAANYADLRNHTYVTVRSLDYAKKVVEKCETIEEAFEAFITKLVKTEYQDKMRKFCDSSTIAKRVHGKSQIDCDYLSKVATGWCRASFLPCEYDENGEVTHVLFAVSSIDDEAAKDIEEGINNKKTLETIFNEVPGGIILYEWTGKELLTLKISKYYADLYGYSMVNDSNRPDFMRIHPDDIEKYRKAIAKALNETHQLEYVFRVWNVVNKCYEWTQINAIAKPQGDGTSLVYAMYTDVTRQKNAEIEIAKKQASLESALNATNQLCCEYDPFFHTIECFIDNNFFGIPKKLDNYPECVRNFDFIHPDDLENFISIVHSCDNGKERTFCDVRAKREGEYKWFSCRFEPYYDMEKERTTIILTITDATMRMLFMQNYEAQLKSMLSGKEDTLSVCTVNITKNTFKMVGLKKVMKEFVDEDLSYENVMLGITDYMLREDDKEKYRNTFCRKNLLNLVSKGIMHVNMEYLLMLSEGHYEWITAYVDMVNNPMSGEVTGIAYSRSSQKKHMEKELLSKALSKDYLFAAVVFKDTDEFYIYDAKACGFGERKEHFWDVAFEMDDSKCSKETLDYMKKFYSKEQMLTYLDNHSEFIHFFDSKYSGKNTRLRAKFRYLDSEKTALLVTMRNFTDEALYEQWKYDSEHDELTGLYNRKMVFADCRRLLNEHPDKKFVMIHCDVKHFHLYNSFFGEKAGDKLLQRIAEVIKSFEKDYCCYTCGRLNADVFCIFLPVENDKLQRDIQYCFDELDDFSPNFPVRLAIGVYWVTDSSLVIEEMFTRATIAAKSGRKNLFGMISKYDEELDQEMKAEQEITSEMNAAIANQEFKVYLQPKYSLRSEKLVGAEALVRWIHPEKGMISPGRFIPAFEKNGFIAELDRYMWEHVCQILKRWQEEGKVMYPVSVNISRVSMYSHETVLFIQSLIEKYELDPKYLELELTETAYMDDPEDLKRMLRELKDYGFKILMDDFGSGYSSLNTLRELPVDILKLDMKFLSTVKNDMRGLAVLSSVVRMSKLLELPIVAEGVELKEQADYLRSIGCEYVQGYLYGRPMPIVEYEGLLTEEVDDSINDEQNVEEAEKTTAEDALEETFSLVGELEYDQDRFAYIKTNKKFLEEFNLIENLTPASRAFRDHMDDKNYDILLDAFSKCSETKDSIFISVDWRADDGSTCKYHGYVRYHGKIGAYSDLSITFINVTGMRGVDVNEVC